MHVEFLLSDPRAEQGRTWLCPLDEVVGRLYEAGSQIQVCCQD